MNNNNNNNNNNNKFTVLAKPKHKYHKNHGEEYKGSIEPVPFAFSHETRWCAIYAITGESKDSCKCNNGEACVGTNNNSLKPGIFFARVGDVLLARTFIADSNSRDRWSIIKVPTGININDLN